MLIKTEVLFSSRRPHTLSLEGQTGQFFAKFLSNILYLPTQGRRETWALTILSVNDLKISPLCLFNLVTAADCGKTSEQELTPNSTTCLTSGDLNKVE